MGAEYSNEDGLSPSASSASGKTFVSNAVQSQSVLINPSNVITAELAPSTDGSKVSAQASSGMNSSLAVSGNSLTSGTKFRIIAYRADDGSYQAYQDYTVGQPALPMMLDAGVAYNLIVYSFGRTTLPTISSEEMSTLPNATWYGFSVGSIDLMYQKIPFSPVAGVNNPVNITLQHKLTQITTILNSKGTAGNITSVSNASISPNYTSGNFSLSTGVLNARNGIGSASVTFPPINNSTVTSTPVLINTDTQGNANATFKATVTIGGTTTDINVGGFNITPGNKSNLTINISKCGAYLSADTSVWKEFMCHNLGADTSKDPFSPSAAIQGAKYQWGAQTGEANKYYSQAYDQSNTGAKPSWNLNMPLNSNSWQNNTGLTKGVNDPCPSGYRVPSYQQMTDLVNSNTVANGRIERVGTWSSVFNDYYNYSAALYFKTNGQRSLMLPVAGMLNHYDGSLSSVGYFGRYWSALYTINGFYLEFTNNILGTNDFSPLFALPIRCIKG
ncbi:hypothetical protein [Elizabethkingia anophelis]|uniref:hypothetical protein n=1 Tax=Elizabethkingia anophelis TaxID=1117645 RepID=UPI0032080971